MQYRQAMCGSGGSRPAVSASQPLPLPLISPSSPLPLPSPPFTLTSPSQIQLGGLGSTVSSPSRVRGGASTTNAFLWTPAQRKRASMLYFANVFIYFILFIYYGRLILRPWLTEVRENFTRGKP